MAEQFKNEEGINKTEDEKVTRDYKENNGDNKNSTSSDGFFSKISALVPDYLRKRLIPAIILIPIAIAIIYSSKTIFAICVLMMAILMAFEWITIVKTEVEGNKWKFLGLAYIMVPCASLLYLRNAEKGSDVILWLLLIVWATDIGGLIIGKTFGGPKLAPSISPNKTWAGLIGGVLASMFVGLVTSLMFKESPMFFIVLSGILAVIEQMSDLLESRFKRFFNVKDSGNIIPGHGGMMDRVDGLTLTAPVVAIMLMLSNNIF